MVVGFNWVRPDKKDPKCDMGFDLLKTVENWKAKKGAYSSKGVDKNAKCNMGSGEVGARRQFVRGCVEDDPQRPRVPQGRGNPAAPGSQPRLSPDERVAEARACVLRLEAALKVLGEDSPEAQPIKEALKKAQDQCRLLLVEIGWILH